jgi:hypothetical protein
MRELSSKVNATISIGDNSIDYAIGIRCKACLQNSSGAALRNVLDLGGWANVDSKTTTEVDAAIMRIHYYTLHLPIH